eukprot:gene60552-82841_t
MLVTIRPRSADPDELTLREARLLSQADRILHGATVPASLLDRARADATRIVCDAPPGHAERVAIEGALGCGAALVWVHLTTNNEQAQAWLTEEAKLPDHIVEPLTATETRPRCDALGDGAYLNLRGRSSEAMTSSDPLASVRTWAQAGRVISVTRKPLVAIDTVAKAIEQGHILDPGDLIAEFASAITADLDPEVADLGDQLDDCEAELN